MTTSPIAGTSQLAATLAALGTTALGETRNDLLKQLIVAAANNGGGGGGAAAWGSITGTLSNQTDLQTALDAKVTASGGSIANTVNLNADMLTALNTKVTLSGDTMTGLLQFSGTTHAGLRLNNLTTAQRDAIAAPAAGMAVWNTTQTRLNLYDGSVWTDGFVRLSGDSMTGALTITPAANAAALTLTGQSLTGSNAQSCLDISGTWNTTGSPTALKVNMTNTASGAAANLLDLQIGGSSLTKVTKAGYLTAVRFGADTGGIRYFYENGGSTFFNSGGTDVVQFSAAGMGVKSGVLYLENGINMAFRTGAGTKIGTATTEKLAFWNATPVAQPAHIADPSGGATIDAEARTAINAILAWQATLGLTAAS